MARLYLAPKIQIVYLLPALDEAAAFIFPLKTDETASCRLSIEISSVDQP